MEVQENLNYLIYANLKYLRHVNYWDRIFYPLMDKIFTNSDNPGKIENIALKFLFHDASKARRIAQDR